MSENAHFLIDTDVLIWMMRGHEGATERLGQLLPWQLSVVTYIELAQGCRNKTELTRLRKGLAQSKTTVLALTPAISDRAMALIDAHALSHGLQLGDALIAATALEHGLTLLTGNVKHFAKVPKLNIEAFAA
jgi:predicted nucleic acid-binding protein